MPASSKAQKQLFGLVRAVQKGEVPPQKVTSNVRQMAKDASPTDVDDMADTSVHGLPDKVQMPKKEGSMNFFDIVSKYNEYGKHLKRDRSLSELAKQVSDIAEYAEITLTNEAGEWFDGATIQRNLKELKNYAKQFSKLAMEGDQQNQRMQALFDDMGRVLERYFEIYDENPMESDLQNMKPSNNVQECGCGETKPHAHKMEEDSDYEGHLDHSARHDQEERQAAITRERNKKDAERKRAEQEARYEKDRERQRKAYSQNQWPKKNEVNVSGGMDDRVVNLLRHKLSEEQLAKFERLPLKIKIGIAWKALKK